MENEASPKSKIADRIEWTPSWRGTERKEIALRLATSFMHLDTRDNLSSFEMKMVELNKRMILLHEKRLFATEREI